MHAVARNYFLTVLLFSGSVAASTDYQPHPQIIHEVKSFLVQHMQALGEDVQVGVNPPDHRLRLPRCTVPLRVFSANGKVEPGSVTVGVRCLKPKPWTIYVSSHVRLYMEVATAARSLQRGHQLSRQDLVMKRMDVASLRAGYITDSTVELGKILRRPMRTGAVVYVRNLETKDLVERGDRVSIQAQAPDFQISMEGVALDSGGKGERIQVRNVQSKRIVEGQIVDVGTVRVSL